MSNNILVCGLTNIETTKKIDSFPVEYSPVDYKFFCTGSSISGVGYNIVKALKKLGSDPLFFSIIGNDIYKDIILNDLKNENIKTDYVLPLLDQTAQSVILNDGNRRKILLDLKNVQEIKYPQEKLKDIISKIDTAVICNINFSRDFLKIFKDNGKMVASDVHVLSDINDSYNNDFIKYSDILFLSNENIKSGEKDMINKLIENFNHQVIVVSMGGDGLFIYTKKDGDIKRFPAVYTRGVVNTIGAGDALFSCFNHFYSLTKDAYYSIKLATVFASYKIGENGGAKGFLTENELIEMYNRFSL